MENFNLDMIQDNFFISTIDGEPFTSYKQCDIESYMNNKSL